MCHIMNVHWAPVHLASPVSCAFLFRRVGVPGPECAWLTFLLDLPAPYMVGSRDTPARGSHRMNPGVGALPTLHRAVPRLAPPVTSLGPARSAGVGAQPLLASDPGFKQRLSGSGNCLAPSSSSGDPPALGPCLLHPRLKDSLRDSRSLNVPQPSQDLDLLCVPTCGQDREAPWVLAWPRLGSQAFGLGRWPCQALGGPSQAGVGSDSHRPDALCDRSKGSWSIVYV